MPSPNDGHAVHSGGRRERLLERRGRISGPGFGQVIIERGFRYSHHPADLGNRVLFRIVKLDSELAFGRIERFWPPALPAPGTRGGKPRLGPFTAQVPLEFRESPEHVEDKLSATRTGVNVLSQAHQANPGFLERAGKNDQVMQ